MTTYLLTPVEAYLYEVREEMPCTPSELPAPDLFPSDLTPEGNSKMAIHVLVEFSQKAGKWVGVDAQHIFNTLRMGEMAWVTRGLAELIESKFVRAVPKKEGDAFTVICFPTPCLIEAIRIPTK